MYFINAMWTKEVNTNVSVSTGQLYCGNKQSLNSLASPTKIFFSFSAIINFVRRVLAQYSHVGTQLIDLSLSRTAYDVKKTEFFRVGIKCSDSEVIPSLSLTTHWPAVVTSLLVAKCKGTRKCHTIKSQRGESQKKLVNSINNLHKSITLPSRQFLYILLSSHFHFCLNH